jgi:hypothetical protein
MGDEFELNVGYFEDPASNPPGAPAGKAWTAGNIAVADVLRRPQG